MRPPRARSSTPPGPAHVPEGHGHTHGVIDPSITTSTRGIWAARWSFVVLVVAASAQAIIAGLSGSVALLADTIHNFSDAGTSGPLWIAFALSRWRPTKRFTYGYGRVEDLAGLAVVLIIASSGVVAGVETVWRFIHPQPVSHLGALGAAAVLGFLANEIVAVMRIRAGREIQSAALVADGYHARVDGWTSLSVLASAAGQRLGYDLVDPVVGLLITAAIAQVVWQSSRAVFARMLDGIEPEVVDQVRHAVAHVPGVESIHRLRARWVGHRLHVELAVGVAPDARVDEAHRLADDIRHEVRDHLRATSSVIVEVEPKEGG